MQRDLVLPRNGVVSFYDVPGRILLPKRWHVCRDGVQPRQVLSGHRPHGHDDLPRRQLLSLPCAFGVRFMLRGVLLPADWAVKHHPLPGRVVLKCDWSFCVHSLRQQDLCQPTWLTKLHRLP